MPRRKVSLPLSGDHMEEASQPLKSLRRFLHLSSSNHSVPPPDPRFQPLPSQPSKSNYSGTSSSSLIRQQESQAKSRQGLQLPGQIETVWHVSPVNRGAAEVNPYPDPLTTKTGQNGHTFNRTNRSRMPNLNDLKETAL